MAVNKPDVRQLAYTSDVWASFTWTSARVKLVHLVNKVAERGAGRHPLQINCKHLLKKRYCFGKFSNQTYFCQKVTFASHKGAVVLFFPPSSNKSLLIYVLII